MTIEHSIKTCDYCGREGKMPTFMTGETACMNCTKKRAELIDPRKVMALSKENEQLKARVAELRQSLGGLLSDLCAYHRTINGVDIKQQARDAFNHTPAQSLACIKAQTLREYAEKRGWGTLGDAICFVSEIAKEADRIEQEAREK